MRISKTVREYIEKEVEKRLMPKYEADKEQAKANRKKVEAFNVACSEAAKDAWMDYFEAHFHELSDFCTDERVGSKMPSFYTSAMVGINNIFDDDSIYKWEYRLRQEMNDTVKNIIVELELGGTKADLERLLNEVGK